MRLKIIVPALIVTLILSISSCGKKEKKPKVVQPAPEFQTSVPDNSDRQPNGGMLRYTLAGRVFEDEYFVALFTPRGDIFRTDNLQYRLRQISPIHYQHRQR